MAQGGGDGAACYFCFMVDDMIFFNDVNVTEILNNFETLGHQKDQESPFSNCLAVHLKLYPGVRYSHTNDRIINLPKNFKKVMIRPKNEDGINK